MAVLGSISDGLRGDYLTLSIKSILDGFISIAFASTLGIGVAFSALPVLAYLGGISLAASRLNALVTDAMKNELTATGGILLMGVGLSSILELKKIRVGNMLPALVVAPVLVIYPEPGCQIICYKRLICTTLYLLICSQNNRSYLIEVIKTHLVEMRYMFCVDSTHRI